MSLPENPSESTKRLNPHLWQNYGSHGRPDGVKSAHCERQAGQRVRQSSKPVLNKLESEWLEQLKATFSNVVIHSQEWRVKIGNGAWFKVDHCAFIDGRWTAWEVKGPKEGKNVARGLLALKCAARAFPEVEWILVWKQNGIWSQQIILP